MGDEREILDIPEPDGFTFGNREQQFSHQLKVSMVYDIVAKGLAVEMKAGYQSFITDSNGATVPIYHPDTRLIAIESIKTLYNVMIADIIGSPYETSIKKLLEKKTEFYDRLVLFQEEWYNSLDWQEQQRYIRDNPNFLVSLNTKKLYMKEIFYQDFINEELEIYRNIFEQLELCIALQTKYFKKVIYANRADPNDVAGIVGED